MAKIISIFNQAGGVAKTTLTQNLGYHLARRNHRVLLIDIDPQASLTIFMGLDIDELEHTLYDALVDEEPLYIEEGLTGMDLAPANMNLSAAEITLVCVELREFRLRSAIEPIEENYDFILIDCPSNLGLLSYNALSASTHVLVPIETEVKAFQATGKLLETTARVRNKFNRQLKIAGFVPTRHEPWLTQHSRTLGAIQEQLASVAAVFPPLPRSTSFPDAAEQHLPLALFDAKHPALKTLEQIADGMENLCSSKIVDKIYVK